MLPNSLQSRSGNVELAQVYQLGQEVVAKSYKHDEFLAEVIGQRQSRKNKHIAIVGEPGAGKTTLLGAIASFIKSKTQDLPIFISLASLQGRTIQDYLLKVWLPEAMGLFNPEVAGTSAIEDELIKQFRKGGVWLLLDGVDEMGADSPVEALATIQKQLTNWVGQAWVVLTCRLNVWDANVNNMLTGFDTYKTQEFTQEQADQFIQEWFACAEKPQLGKQLQAKLNEQGRERIRDLVKHPLRLALLSQTFYLDKQGKLPETKAALYQRFNHYFYEWKQSLYPVDLTTRNELHQALGKLALAGINSQARFRLRQSLAFQEMGERLFNLADTLGWLNLVDREAETDEPVYAFLHPMFQEYFAALAVENWDYFLPRTHGNQNPKPVRDNYPIFAPQWKEVILLWLGLEDVPKQQKEEFIKALIGFEDGCGDFYQRQAYLLAAAGIAEFRQCSDSEKIVNWIIKYKFGYLTEKQQDLTFLLNISLFQQETRNALAETDRERVVPALVQLLHPDQNENTRLLAAIYLTEFDNSHTTAINSLLQLIKSDGNKLTRMVAVLLLAGIRLSNQVDIPIIDSLVQLSERDENKLTRLLAALLLEEIDPGNQNATNVPLYLIERDENKFTRLLATLLLANIDSVHQVTLDNLILQLMPNSERKINWVSFLSQLAQLREKVEQICKQFNTRSKNGISSLLNLLYQLTETTRYDELLPIVIVSLSLLGSKFIDPDRKHWEHFFDQLVEYISAKLSEICVRAGFDLYETCNDILWRYAQSMTYPGFYRAWHGEPLQVQALENQFIDIASQLQATDKTYPIVINVQTLEGETDTSAIAQALCNRIYRAAFGDNSEIPPEVSNAYQLERLIPQIKKQLQKQNLVLILDRCEPNQVQITFCRKLSDVLYIAWITAAPLEPPLKGFPPEQPNLKSAIQSWIDEIG